MTFELNEQKYKISWRYDTVLLDYGIHGARHCTYCSIFQLIDGEWYLLISVEIKQYYKDKRDKNKARKISLEKAMNTLGIGKKERTEIWNQYYKMRNNKW